MTNSAIHALILANDDSLYVDPVVSFEGFGDNSLTFRLRALWMGE